MNTTEIDLEGMPPPQEAAMMAAEITLVDQNNAEPVASMVDALRELAEKIEAHYAPILSAQQAAVDAVRAARDSQLDLVKEAAEHLRGLLADFAKRTLAARAADGDTDRSVAGGITARVTWAWEIVDPLMVPREFLLLDEKAISAAVRAKGAAHGIAGIRAVQKVGVAVARANSRKRDPAKPPREATP